MNGKLLKKIICSVLAATTIASASIMTTATAEETKRYARSETTSAGGVLLGGRYIEVGASTHGSFGANVCGSTKFHNNWYMSYGDYLGLLVDSDGWDEGSQPTTGDFFTPGSPEERWTFGYSLGGTERYFGAADMRGGLYGNWKIAPFMTDLSDTENGKLAAELYGVTTDDVEMKVTYTFGEEDKQYLTTVEIKNNGTESISDVRFARTFDPDQDKWYNDTYRTYNKVVCNPDPAEKGSTENFAMVVARGSVTLEGFYFLSFDNRARASASYFSFESPFSYGLWYESTEGQAHTAPDEAIALTSEMVGAGDSNGYILEDSGIAITLREESLDAGAEIEPFKYYSSLDPNVEEALKTAKEMSLRVISGLTTLTVPDADPDCYYAVFDITGTKMLKDWSNDVTPEGTVIFDGLLDGTKYIIKSISAETYLRGAETATEDEIEEMVAQTLSKHNYVEQTIEPTCINPGYTICTCSDCGDCYIKNIVPTIPHKYTSETFKPTCTERGYTVCTCSECGDQIVKNFVPALEHDYEKTVIAPTCTEKGYTLYQCKNCKSQYMADLTEKAEHNYITGVIAPTCVDRGYTQMTCADCGKSYKTNYTDRIPHNYTTQVVNPTCIAEGYTLYACKECGYSKISDVVRETGHTPYEIMENGVIVIRCRKCGCLLENVEDEYIAVEEGTVAVPMKSITKGQDVTLKYKESINTEMKSNNGKVIYTSSNINVATVDENGKITARGRGTATITARLEGTEIVQSQNVTVKYTWWQFIHALFGGHIWYFNDVTNIFKTVLQNIG